MLLVTGGCIYDPPNETRITIVNDSSNELEIRFIDLFRGRVAAGEESRVAVGGPTDRCWRGVSALSEEIGLVAHMPEPVCEGDVWVIEDDDLVPISDDRDGGA